MAKFNPSAAKQELEKITTLFANKQQELQGIAAQRVKSYETALRAK